MSAPSDRIRVLHVDDDGAFAELTAAFLQREDDRIEVVTATDTGEGLDRLAERDVDCVVSDYDMPGLDGLAFLEAVRATDPDLPFIIGQLGQFEGQTWSDARSQVNEAHIEVAAEVPNVAFVSSIDLTAKPDGVHFDAESAREFGRRYAEVYRELVD